LVPCFVTAIDHCASGAAELRIELVGQQPDETDEVPVDARQLHERFARDVAADLLRRDIHEGGLGGDVHRLLDGPDLHLYVDARGLANLQDEILAVDLLEPCELGGDLVGARNDAAGDEGPSAPLTVSRNMPVAWFRTTTEAPGNTAPCASRTCPRSSVVPCCAVALALISRASVNPIKTVFMTKTPPDTNHSISWNGRFISFSWIPVPGSLSVSSLFSDASEATNLEIQAVYNKEGWRDDRC
jgi:hypothetical protein